MGPSNATPAAPRPAPRAVPQGRLARRLALALAAVCLLGAPLTAAETAAPDPACGGHDLRASLASSGKLAAIEAAAAAVPNGQGRLFRIERPGTAPSFLFGTMHLTDPRVLALPPVTRTAFDASDRLVIETTGVLDEMAALGAMLSRPDLTNMPKGKTLNDFLTPQTRREVEAGLKEFGIPLQSIETLQPWFFSTTIFLPACEVTRTQAGAKVLDAQLAADAKAAGKEVLGLESLTEQLEAIASLPMDLQVDSLVTTLQMKKEMPDVFETMTALYLDGRVGMIAPLVEGAVPAGRVGAQSLDGYKEFDRRIITDRNHRMVERLGPILARGDVFVAVGALHLPGPEGLVELLRREGWRLSRAD